VRTPPFLPDAQLDSTALPALPRVSCILLTASGLDGATGHLADLARRTVAAL
jgi:hypothetical protein